MTFLEICQRLRQEAGISGSGPVSVLAQTGDMKRVVDWASDSYRDIQSAYKTWRFLRKDFSFDTISGTANYLPTSVSITDFSSWVPYNMSLYKEASDEVFLGIPLWDEFRQEFLVGTNRTSAGRPSIVAIKPDNSLQFWQVPNDAFKVVGEYYKIPDVMDADGDTPLFPARFSMIIVWKGLMSYGAWANASEKYAHGKTEYERMKPQLEGDQLEQFSYGAPLA